MDSSLSILSALLLCLTCWHVTAAPSMSTDNNDNNDNKQTAVKLPFSQCGGQVLEVRAFGCKDNRLPCVMTRGTTGRLEVDFVPAFDSRSLYAEVRGRVGSPLIPVYVPLQNFHKEACVGHGITCPVRKGSRLTYVYEMLVDNTMPYLSTDAIWKMTDYWGFTVACFKADIHIN